MTSLLNVTVAAILAVFGSAALAQDAIGVVKRSHGEVSIDRGGVQLPSTPGLEIQRGDRLITGADGYASISMHRAASVSIGPGTAVALDRYAAEDLPVAQKPAPRILQGLASFLAVNKKR